ncbi:MAG: DUF2029 domain-containing protein [Jatrophihabitans sp.]|nr:MAG: DUF2029 domain-containing protein [Jatrophihabitans sp.]
MVALREPGRVPTTREARLRDLRIRHVWPLWLAVAAFTAKGIWALGPAKVGIDAHAYWLTGHHWPLYWRPPAAVDAYLYSPAFAQAIRPLTLLPWPAFYALWICAETAAFAWLLKPLGWAWGVPALMLCAFEIVPGNVTGFVAAAAVLGMSRRPEAWTFVALTKPSLMLGLPSALGRRDWRGLRRMAVAVAAVVAVSAAIWPGQWAAWITFLFHDRGSDPTLPYRVGASWLLAAVAARRRRPWLVVPLMVLASPPTLAIGEYATLFAAVPRLRLMAGAR